MQVAPIMDADIAEAAAFLHVHLNPHVDESTWASAITAPWGGDAPNHGFILRQGQDVHGVLLAFYSKRTIDGVEVDICNLGAWCVLPAARLRSLGMLKAALSQEGYAFTDLSPSGNVVALNRRLGFTELDSRAVLVPAVPMPPRRGHRIVTNVDEIPDHLGGRERRLYDDHRGALAARHAVLLTPEGSCYVIYRHDRRKGLPVFATILYVSDRSRFTRSARRLASRLLRSGVLAVLVDQRVGGRPEGSLDIRMNRPKMVRSGPVDPESFDYLYSELTCVPW